VSSRLFFHTWFLSSSSSGKSRAPTMHASESKMSDGPIAGQKFASNAGSDQVQETRSVPPSPPRARSPSALLAAAPHGRSVKVPNRFSPGHDQDPRKPSIDGAYDTGASVAAVSTLTYMFTLLRFWGPPSLPPGPGVQRGSWNPVVVRLRTRGLMV